MGKKAVGASSQAQGLQTARETRPALLRRRHKKGSFALFFLSTNSSPLLRKAMAVAYASAYRAAGGKQNRRPAPKRGQVKAAIAASWLHALASVVHGARSVALSRSHSRWSFRSS
ncbi:unnamed protein product [Sphagnum compactum]